METLKSRERVIKAINHEPIDRMPIDLGGFLSTGISAFAYWNLREQLGLSTENIEIPDVFQFLARVDDDILERFHCDCKLLQPKWPKTRAWNPRGRYQFQIPDTMQPMLRENGSWEMERFGRKMVMPDGGFFFDGDYFPLNDETEDEQLNVLKNQAERIYKDSDYYTMYIGYHAYFDCANVDWHCKMITDPEEIYEGNRRTHEQQMKHVRKIIDNIGEHIQAIVINSDLGSQHAPLCNPALHQKL